MPFAVETVALTKRYPRQRGLVDVLLRRPGQDSDALRGVSLAIEEGEVFGLLGPNGSGKTTLLKVLSTILAPSSGSARVFGIDVTRDPRRVRQLVALVTGEERSLYWRLSGRQNLEFFARLYGLTGSTARRKIDELLEMFDLSAAADLRVSNYSTGMRQRLAIARGLVSSPRLLCLDEPTRGLDPVAAHTLLTLVKERAVERFDNTVILTTHIAREVEQLCRRITMLNTGAVVYAGTVEDLKISLQRGQTYVLTVHDLSDERFEALRHRLGGDHCRRIERRGAALDVEMSLPAAGMGLSDVLRHLLVGGATIARCTRREPSFEDMFRAVFDGQARPAGSPASRAAGVEPVLSGTEVV